MWSRACLLITAVLAGGLVLTRRRLSNAQAELERERAELERERAELERERVALRATQAFAGGPRVTGDGLAATRGQEQAETATTGSDLSWEWEQAVSPTDS